MTYELKDWLNSINQTKNNLIDETPDALKEYAPYIINRCLSGHIDCIMYANEMNMRHALFDAAQFDYYKSVLRKRKRFSKWPKADKDINLDAIQEVYQCNRTVAKQYLKVLNKEQLETIHDKINEGG